MEELSLELIQQLIQEKKTPQIKEIFDNYPDADLAEITQGLDVREIILIFKLIPNRISASIFSYFDYDFQEEIISTIANEDLSSLTTNLSIDDFADIVNRLPSNMVKKILSSITKEKREIINKILDYKDNTAGALMTVEYVELKSGLTCQEALSIIKSTGKGAETINHCYIVNETRELIGDIMFKDIFFADNSAKVNDLMELHFITVDVDEDQETVASFFKKYDISVVPVVNDENRLMGIITVDDIIDVIDQESTEDIQKMEGIQPLEKSYLETSPFVMVKKTILWLMVLMISAIFTGGIISSFEGAIAEVAILAVFMPMLMDTGGNSAGQSSSLIIRGIALNEVKLRDWSKILKKEFIVGLIDGTILGIVCFLRIIITNALFNDGGTFWIAVTVGLTLMIVVTLAKITGGLLPMIAKLVHLDPALMAGPLVTTIIDALALFSYFSIATQLVLKGVR